MVRVVDFWKFNHPDISIGKTSRLTELRSLEVSESVDIR